jgi:glycolate oxidase
MTTTTTTGLIDSLRAIVGAGALLTSPTELLVYECDGYTIEKNKPEVVVFPTSTEQVVQVVQACNRFGVPFLPRGAGTSLAGGCLPVGRWCRPAGRRRTTRATT